MYRVSLYNTELNIKYRNHQGVQTTKLREEPGGIQVYSIGSIHAIDRL